MARRRETFCTGISPRRVREILRGAGENHENGGHGVGGGRQLVGEGAIGREHVGRGPQLAKAEKHDKISTQDSPPFCSSHSEPRVSENHWRDFLGALFGSIPSPHPKQHLESIRGLLWCSPDCFASRNVSRIEEPRVIWSTTRFRKSKSRALPHPGISLL